VILQDDEPGSSSAIGFVSVYRDSTPVFASTVASPGIHSLAGHTFTMMPGERVTVAASGSASSDGIGIASLSVNLDLEVVPHDCSVDFAASPTEGLAELEVSFRNISPGPAVSYLWDFGDGAVSELENPIHAYTTLGSYAVTLLVNGPCGERSATKKDYIVVSVAGGCTVGFDAQPRVGFAPLSVQFINNTICSAKEWHWNFGDGSSSTLQHPAHIYTQDGHYTVSLTVTDADGRHSVTKQSFIRAVRPQFGFPRPFH